jgi:F0F1-type ATP synthase membrane subunit a
LELITQFTPLISISFRLFGNLLGGTIIMGLVYSLLIGAQASFSPDATSEAVKRIFETNSELNGYSPTEQYAYF